MTVVDKTQPDVLRVTEYVLEHTKIDKEFSVQSADKSKELNGIGRHRIAQIMRDICLDPNGKGSLITYTTVDHTNMDNNYARWQLKANAYFSYLSYQSVVQAKESNKTAAKALWVAILAVTITVISIIISVIVC